MKKTARSAEMILLFSIVYFVSYLTRNSYNVVLTELMRQTGFGQAALALCVTGSLITYGAGQLASGFLGDRMQPKRLILLGLSVTACMNLLMAFCREPSLMLVIWCVNGLAQAFLWPPLVRLMAALFVGEEYEKAMVAVSWGGSVGNIALYLTAPAFITLFGVSSVFITAALCALSAAAVLAAKCPSISVRLEEKEGSGTGKYAFFKMPLVWCIFLIIILQGVLRDGITTWTPVYINETYHLGSSFSILSGTALPLFSLAAIQASSLLHRRLLHNPMTCAAALFGLGGVSGLLLALFPGAGTVPSVGLCALLTGCMHGVNLILIGVLPAYFQRFGRVSLFSGLLNAFTYVGSALSAYGYAAAADHAGWQAVIGSWPVTAVLGMAVCLLCVRPWRRFQDS